MTVEDIANRLKFIRYTAFDTKMIVNDVYVCDLLSHAMANCKKDDVWITILSNINVAAVAHLTEVSCVVLAEDVQPDKLLIEKSKQNGILLFGTSLNAYKLCLSIDRIMDLDS